MSKAAISNKFWPQNRRDFDQETQKTYESFDVKIKVNGKPHEAVAVVHQTPSIGLWVWAIYGPTMPGVIPQHNVFDTLEQAKQDLAVRLKKNSWKWTKGKGYSL